MSLLNHCKFHLWTLQKIYYQYSKLLRNKNFFRPSECDQPCVQLIDFGRSIDMTLFPPDTTFTHTVKTADFICHEMREKLPWTYQVNIFIVIFFCSKIKYMNFIID